MEQRGIGSALAENETPRLPIVIKKYANRRLYDTEASVYITLDSLAGMVRAGRDFVVLDAKTGDDITRAVLTQIIVEEETRGRNMLPLAFLRQLIAYYGDRMQGVVPDYLERMMSDFANQQVQLRSTVQRTMETLLSPEVSKGLSPAITTGMQEVGRQNLEMMDRAMTLFAPFYRLPDGGEAPAAKVEVVPAAEAGRELAALREEVTQLRRELEGYREAGAKPARGRSRTTK